MINVSLPPEIELFVNQVVAQGEYPSREELVTDAVRFFRDSKLRRQNLRDEIAEALEDVEAGFGTVIDSDESLAAFFDSIETEVHAELANEKNRKSLLRE